MSSTVEHVARWWFANRADPEGTARFRAAVQGLAGVPGVSRLSIGTATEVPWSGPDQTWDVGFVVTFDSYDAVEGYLSHPAHQAVVDLATELAARIDVFYLDV